MLRILRILKSAWAVKKAPSAQPRPPDRAAPVGSAGSMDPQMYRMNAYHAGAAAGAAAATLCVAARFSCSQLGRSQRRLGGVLTGLQGAPDKVNAASGPATGQQLAGKVALITGGGTGVGKVTALAYAAEGAHVVLAGRRSGPIEEVAAECEALGVQALAVSTDLGDPLAVEALFDACKEKFGRLDILCVRFGLLPRVRKGLRLRCLRCAGSTTLAWARHPSPWRT
jgi:hypothetical protein